MRAKLSISLIALAAGLLVLAPGAQALSKHVFSTSFSGEGPTALSNPTDVAVDQSTGDVYVVDNGNHRVEKFTPSGEFIFMVGQEVDKTKSEQPGAPNSEKDLCTAASGDVCQAARLRPGQTTSDINPGELSTPYSIAVDNSGGLGDGDFYVASAENENPGVGKGQENYLTKFDSQGHLVMSWQNSGQLILDQSYSFFTSRYGPPGSIGSEIPTGIAVGPEGSLYLTVRVIKGSPQIDVIYRFGQFGAFASSAILPPSLYSAPSLPGSRIAAGQVGSLLLTEQADEAVHSIDPEGTDLGVITGSGFGKPPTALAYDLSREVSYVADAGTVIRHYGPGCQPSSSGCPIVDSFGAPGLGDATGLAVDEATNTVYVSDAEKNQVAVFDPAPNLPDVLTTQAKNQPTATTATLFGEVGPAAAGNVEECKFEYGTTTSYSLGTLPCLDSGGTEVGTASSPIAAPTAVHADITGLTPETTYHYRLSAANANGSVSGRDRAFVPHHVIGLTTDPATGVSGEAATLNGSLLGDGTDTHYYFEWGKTPAYGDTSPAPPGSDLTSPAGPAPTALTTNLTGLEPSTTYHYRVLAENHAGQTSLGLDREFTTPADLPQVSGVHSAEVFADTALLRAQVNPGAGDTVYHAEFGAEECSVPGAPCETTPTLGGHAGNGKSPVAAQVPLNDLQPDTLYHYLVIAENSSGSTRSAERTFTTLPNVNPASDLCPNAHVRQQTSAASLPDCRAYELVSAANAGGYDVESDLVPGQQPFAGYPQADGRVLYGVHDGGIPGTDHPTNRGVDPYVATRGENGWSTEYVGIPSNNPFAVGPFSSTLSGASSALEALAFGGPEGCSPCFEGGYTGIPVRLANGKLVQGMVAAPSVSPPPGPSAQPDGQVAKDLSADGSHLIFGSTTLFAPGGNDETGDVSIYDRNLKTGETHVVSNDPAGNPLSCLQGVGKCDSAEADADGIAELDISSDGSHVLIGQKVSEDAEGHPYYHLYMDIGVANHSLDLTPNTTTGVLYAGMSADGSKVFFTTKDRLLPGEDEDESADLYEAEVSASSSNLHLLSAGSTGTGNTDNCDPAPNSAHLHWNTVDPEEESCGVVALGGGGGVASGDGTIYFLSPEKLDGSANGTEDAPNLYVVRPGQAPHYVTTLESALTGSRPPKLKHSFDHNFGSFADATGLAVDHSSRDTYVLDLGAPEAEPPIPATVEKFDAEGNPVDFTAGPGAGTNQLDGTDTPDGSFAENAELGLPTQLAVDNDPSSSSHGDLYVPDAAHGVIDRFSSSGEYLSQITGFSGFSLPVGLAVDAADGNLYVASLGGTVSVFDSSGDPLSAFSAEHLLSGIAVDSPGTVYASLMAAFGETGTEVYGPSGEHLRTLDSNPSQSVTVDTSTGDAYVDEGGAIARYDATGKRLESFGASDISGSVGLAIDPEGNLYATTAAGSKVAAFTPSLAPDTSTDNPLVIDSVSAPATRYTADIQINPSGNVAAFGSTLPLADNGEETAGHTEVYRYDSPAEELACVSCQPGGAVSSGDSRLASDGLSLADDGRVFFDSQDPLAAGDTDRKRDVYEWEAPGTGTCRPGSLTFNPAIGACLGLISAGTSPTDSSLLSATADGTDAYFFTRDSLAPQDENGPTMKVYDARVEGGFPFGFPPPGCRASDECHGPASAAPGPQSVGSEAGTPHNHTGKPGCKRGFVRRHDKCIKKPKRHHRRHHHRSANHRETQR